MSTLTDALLDLPGCPDNASAEKVFRDIDSDLLSMASTSALAEPTGIARYDTSGPPDTFRLAAEAGDLNAFKAAADWLRDRGQPADPGNPDGNPSDEERAYHLEACRGDHEIAHCFARKLRRMLELYPSVFSAPTREPLNFSNLSDFLRRHRFDVRGVRRDDVPVHVVDGVPVRIARPVSREDTERFQRNVFCIRLWTDGWHEEDTRQRLLAILSHIFPRGLFLIEFERLDFSDV